MTGAAGAVARGAAAALFAALVVAAIPAPALAHALLRSSDPAANSVVQTAPAAVTMTFTEPPDPRLSRVSVLDASGADHATGQLATGATPSTLVVKVGPLSPGVYTVAWRTVSSVDGHVVGGSFAFGVGVGAGAVVSAAAMAGPAPSAAGEEGQSAGTVAAHWLLYLGLMALLGAAFFGSVVADPHAVGARALGLAWLVAAGATGALAISQASDAGVGVADLPGTSLGGAVLERAVPLLVALPAVLALRGVRGRRRMVLAAIASLAGLALLVDALNSHAGGDPLALPDVIVQWAHVGFVGIWLGGLAALLAELRGGSTDARAATARRFAWWATLGIGVVVLSGLLRAVAEVGSISALTGTSYGQVLLVKGALLSGLAALAAVNHFRHVPRGQLRGIRWFGGAELALGAVLVLAASQLGSLEPPALAAAAERTAPPPALVLSGADYATTVRMNLTVTPGTTGFNTFEATVADYDSGAPVSGAVSLTFRPAARADVGASRLSLQADGAGRYSGSGANLSLDGRWTITALVAWGTGSVVVPLEANVSPPPARIDVSRVPGEPTLYTIHLPEGASAQVYLDPGTPGPNQFHVTFFDPHGGALAVTGMAATVQSGAAAPKALDLRVLGTGHKVADVVVPAAPQTFTISATAPDGTPLQARLTITAGS